MTRAIAVGQDGMTSLRHMPQNSNFAARRRVKVAQQRGMAGNGSWKLDMSDLEKNFV